MTAPHDSRDPVPPAAAAPTGAVRPATAADLGWMTGVLGRSFETDPVCRYVIADHDERLADRIGRMLALIARVHLPHGEVYVTDDRAAIGVWAPPGQWRVPASAYVRHAVGLVSAIGVRNLRRVQVMTEVEHRHPREPHYYLSTLGTDPPAQGRGRGASLIRPMTDRADREGLGCYLESSKDENVAYYHRFGFEVTEKFTLPDGPTMTFMWRDPR